MDHAVDLSELVFREIPGPLQFRQLADVGLKSEDFATEGVNLLQTLQSGQKFRRRFGLLEESVPLLRRRQVGPADENQPRVEFLRQVSGENQAQASEAAGYEVAAFLLEATACLVRNQFGSIETLCPTSAAAKGDDLVGKRSALFGNDLNGVLTHASVFEIQVDAAANDARIFTWNNPDRPQERGHGWIGSYRNCNGLQTIGYDGDVDTGEIFATQGLGKIKQTEESVVQLFLN